MGRKRSFVPLDVYFNNILVGKLAREFGGTLGFSYYQDWLDSTHRFPISLSLPLSVRQYRGMSVNAYFDNLLPDDVFVRKKIARKVDARGKDAFSLLSKIGRDCIGGLQFLNEGQTPDATNALNAEKVNEEQIASILSNLKINPLGISNEDQGFRFSVPGVQEKTTLLFKDNNWFKPSGTTPSTHIIKPENELLNLNKESSKSVENEYFCLKLLENFGLITSKANITRFGNIKALVVERFDRNWTKDGHLFRLHQEDFCQALSVDSSLKYQSEGGPGIKDILECLKGSEDFAQDQYDFFKANILFWLIGASDGHAKNFSILFLPGGRFRLAPIYDVLTAQPFVDTSKMRHRDFRLAMSLGDRNHYRIVNIRKHHFLQTGKKANYPSESIRKIFEEILSNQNTAIESTINSLPANFPMEIVESVNNAIKERVNTLEFRHLA